jgi:hypothetical protein
MGWFCDPENNQVQNMNCKNQVAKNQWSLLFKKKSGKAATSLFE